MQSTRALGALLASTVVGASFAAGCGHGDSTPRLSARTRAGAFAAARRAEHEWRDAMFVNAIGNHDRFRNLPRDVLRARLSYEAAHHHFRVVSFRLLRPRQLAPKIVVRTSHLVALANSTKTILDDLDPKADTGNDATGWTFEGFYFEAQDESGVPFLVTYDAVRDGEPMGSQWARSENLYPFQHG